MSVSSVQNFDSVDFVDSRDMARDLRAKVLLALVSVVQSYLDTVQENYAKIAEQDSEDRRSAQEEGHDSAILNAKLSEESVRASNNSQSTSENKNPSGQVAISAPISNSSSGSSSFAGSADSFSSTKA